MKKREQVSKIMTANPITVNTTNKVSDVAKIFTEKNIHHIPVVSGNDLIGMISKSDIDKISFVTNLQDVKANTAIYDILEIEQVMTSQLDTVQSDAEIRDAASLLAQGNYHAIPVLQGEELQGIITSTDVIKYLLEQY
ncbi:MAG: CBS domain-containing protein [Saprospiraceae bacterium]|nr:CBS domain-containing protein [Saprospiraceae bacterium]